MPQTGVNTDRVRLLVTELRSDRFRKGTGALHRITEDGTETWCCLGVASRVAKVNGLDVASRMVAGREEFGGQPHEFLCGEVKDWYGFDSEDPELILPGGGTRKASTWNDRGPDPDTVNPEPDFTGIADGFERTYLLP